ncbi:FAD-dependent oxidoreductase [Shewanella sp.]|uniref:FAD-dependent oxidoreductase n=1 Tax=Shewanella sp. TaxID=50422 RepID=UPI003561FF7D
MQRTQSCDVAIVGGGMVGLATAIGLAEAGLKVTVLDAGSQAAVDGEPRLRVSAVNRASEDLLKSLGAWHLLDSERLAAYGRMQVWDKDGMGRIGFDANELGEDNLGTIIENDNIAFALAKRAAECDNLDYREGVRLSRLAFGEKEAWLTLEEGDMLSAALVIACDGANSWVRSQCNIPLTFWDYGHTAIVATIETAEPHQDCARQVFLPDGPLAFLPLYQPNLCSIVWSVAEPKAQALLAMDDENFSKSLTAAFDARLGLCRVASERIGFNLRMRYARHFARHRLLLAGDAAHTIHPLAGQGVNLGFQDAAAIIATIGRLKDEGKDIGDYRLLRPLERERKAAAQEMIATMEGFKRLFQGNNPIKQAVRDLGLNLVDKLPGLKTVFIRQAMGR